MSAGRSPRVPTRVVLQAGEFRDFALKNQSVDAFLIYKKALQEHLRPAAWLGCGIAAVAAVLATMLAAVWVGGELTLKNMLVQQFNNPVLWVLDALPLVYAAWGQVSQVSLGERTTELIFRETESLRERTVALERRATRAALFDPLTDLPNRVLLRDRLEQAIKLLGDSSDRGEILIVLIDLVRFREINESIGHHNGDRVLRSVASRLDALRPVRSTLARIGSDEFAMLISAPRGTIDAEGMANAVHDALEPNFDTSEVTVTVRARIGAARYPAHGSNADVLLRRADVATEQAKAGNKLGGLVMYSPEQDRYSPERLTLMTELRSSIEQGELRLHYQPKLNANNLRPVGVEALVRWEHPTRGMVPPGEFIEMAESTGFITDITHWVLGQGMHDCAQFRQQGLDLTLAVNVAAQTLLDADFPSLVASLLKRHHMEADRLVLEITETTVMVDEDNTARILNRLSDSGVRISIDDFGTGYSSLYYLRKLPFSELKIDRSFVMDMLQNKNDAAIVNATVQLAHNLGMTVVAEGVESDAHVSQLLQYGADKLQGFRFTPALPADELPGWLERWNTIELNQMLDESFVAS